MGLRKGTVSFSRYRPIGALPDHFPDFFDERIRKNAFQALWRTAEEKAAGWTGLEDPLDTDFPYASYAQGRYLFFSLRIDRKAVAPSLLRLRVTEAERGKLKETGQKKLYREQRDAIREAVRLELLGKTMPVPSFFEICWSINEGTLIFCSLSDKAAEELQAIFRDSFQLSLAPHLPWDPQSPGATAPPPARRRRKTRRSALTSCDSAGCRSPDDRPGIPDVALVQKRGEKREDPGPGNRRMRGLFHQAAGPRIGRR